MSGYALICFAEKEAETHGTRDNNGLDGAVYGSIGLASFISRLALTFCLPYNFSFQLTNTFRICTIGWLFFILLLSPIRWLLSSGRAIVYH